MCKKEKEKKMKKKRKTLFQYSFHISKEEERYIIFLIFFQNVKRVFFQKEKKRFLIRRALLLRGRSLLTSFRRRLLRATLTLTLLRRRLALLLLLSAHRHIHADPSLGSRLLFLLLRGRRLLRTTLALLRRRGLALLLLGSGTDSDIDLDTDLRGGLLLVRVLGIVRVLRVIRLGGRLVRGGVGLGGGVVGAVHLAVVEGGGLGLLVVGLGLERDVDVLGVADVEAVVDDEAEEHEADHGEEPEDDADGGPLAAEALVGGEVEDAVAVDALGVGTALTTVDVPVHTAVDVTAEVTLHAADEEASNHACDSKQHCLKRNGVCCWLVVSLSFVFY